MIVQLLLAMVVQLLMMCCLQYKRKRSSSDAASVKIEGELTYDWFALDLGTTLEHISY